MTKLVAVDMDGTLLNDKKELPVGFIPWVKSHTSITVAIASEGSILHCYRCFLKYRTACNLLQRTEGLSSSGERSFIRKP